MISSDDYVMKGGNCCPNCKDPESIETGNVEFDAGIAWQSCTCDRCGAEWVDQYKLIGYSDLTV